MVSEWRKLCFWFSLDSVVLHWGLELEGSKVPWMGRNLQSFVQILLDGGSQCECTCVQGRYILKPEYSLELPIWRQLPYWRQEVSPRGQGSPSQEESRDRRSHQGVGGTSAKSQETGGLPQGSEEPQPGVKRQEVSPRRQRHLSQESKDRKIRLRSGPCSRVLRLRPK